MNRACTTTRAFSLICLPCGTNIVATSSAFFLSDTATTEIYTLSLHDALPISYGQEFIPALTWSAAARSRLDRVPSFVRGVVAKRVEDWARERGLHEITPELLTEIRSAMPVDFSKKRPFFVSETDDR